MTSTIASVLVSKSVKGSISLVIVRSVIYVKNSNWSVHVCTTVILEPQKADRLKQINCKYLQKNSFWHHLYVIAVEQAYLKKQVVDILRQISVISITITIITTSKFMTSKVQINSIYSPFGMFVSKLTITLEFLHLQITYMYYTYQE